MLRQAFSPHTTKHLSVGQTMMWVIYAMVPAIIAIVVFFGWGVIFQIIIAVCTAVAAESICLKIRKRPVLTTLRDCTAIVTAVLLAVSIPPSSPWWMTLLGTAFAIVIAKQLYGGLGMNPFNPAMVGYVFLLISFPAEMTAWLPPEGADTDALDFWNTFNLIFFQETLTKQTADAVSLATPLDTLKTAWGLGQMTSEIRGSYVVFDGLSGIGWSWITSLFMFGGIALIYRNIITWHIPVSMVGGIFLMASIFYVFNPDGYASPLVHLFSGATMMGAFFIATDPVSAATSNKGRLIFGFAIGVLTYTIRAWGGYPDGVAFAVLLMNLCVPMIDHYTVPKAYGHS